MSSSFRVFPKKTTTKTPHFKYKLMSVCCVNDFYFVPLCLDRCFVFVRNPKHLEPLNDDDDGSSLQFCVCPRKPNGCVCEKEWSIRLSKEEIAKFPDHGLFQRTNELNGNVERGVNNKRSPYDHTTLPPEIERLDPGHVLRIIYVNLETEELRRQFLERHRKFLQ